MRLVVGIWTAAMLAVACNPAGRGQRIAETPPRTTATLSLKSALIEVPEKPEEKPEVTVSCRGGTVCKELVAERTQRDALDEAREDCEDRGGLVSVDPCPRADVVGECDLGGGAGPIRVFTYDQSGAESVADMCNTMDGTFVAR